MMETLRGLRRRVGDLKGRQVVVVSVASALAILVAPMVASGSGGGPADQSGQRSIVHRVAVSAQVKQKRRHQRHHHRRLQADPTHMGLGPEAPIPSWARGKPIHFAPTLENRPTESTIKATAQWAEVGNAHLTNGGPVQENPHVYAVFWGSNWNKEPGASLRAEITNMYSEISGSAWQGILTQYFGPFGNISHTFPTTTYTDNSVAAPEVDQQTLLINEAKAAASTNGWNLTGEDLVAVFPAPGSKYTFGASGFCAYHGVMNMPSGTNVPFDYLPYDGDEPFKAGCNRVKELPEYAHNTTYFASHEYVETVTDPFHGAWEEPGGNELADLCVGAAPAPGITAYVTAIWDNYLGKCAESDPSPPQIYGTTQSATAVEQHEATLHGSFHPDGQEDKYFFEYGKTSEYGSKSPVLVTTGTAVLAVAQTLTGLEAGVLYHFRLAATNPDMKRGSTGGKDFTFMTPGPYAETEPATEIGETSARLNATVNPNGAATKYQFEYGPTTSYGSKVPLTAEELGAGTAAVQVSKSISLAKSTVVHYRIAATSGAITNFGADRSFMTYPHAPEVTTKPATNSTLTQVTLNGTVNPGGSSTTYYFEYGENVSFGEHYKVPVPSASAGSGKSNVEVSQTLTVGAGREYFYHLVATNAAGTTADSTWQSARTLGPHPHTSEASAVKATSATLNGTIRTENAPTTYQFEYGPTTSYGTSVPVPAGVLAGGAGSNYELHEVISGLSPVTTYHFRLRASDSVATSYTPDRTFATLVEAPTVTTEPATGVSKFGATLNASVIPNGAATTYKFEYGPTASYGSSVPVPAEAIGAGGSAVKVAQGIDLAPATVYHYRISATNSKGTRTGSDRTVVAGVPGYASSFGTPGSTNGKFEHPGDVVADSKGNLWVADTYNHRIQKFHPSGEFMLQVNVSGGGEGQPLHPSGLAVDAKDNVYVADWASNRIEEFSSSGAYVRRIGSTGSGNGQLSGPEDVAIDAKGNIWVSDTWNGRLEEFDAAGAFVRVAGSHGSGTGQLGQPCGLDIDAKGNIWVADWQNNRVSEFNETGGFVRQFGSEGTGNGAFNRPDAIAVDGQGGIWVGDQDNGRLEEFNEAGEYLAQIGSPGSGNGQFSFLYPMGIEIDATRGNMWVTDTRNNRVQKWVVSGPTYRSSFGSPGSGNGQFDHPGDVAKDSEGNLWVADTYNHRIQKFTQAGSYLLQVNVSGGGEGQPLHPSGLAVDAKDNVYVADWASNRIEEFSSSGAYVRRIGSTGSGNGQLSGPEDVAIDAKGNIWVSDTWNGRLEEFNEAGAFVRVAGNTPGPFGQLAEPTGIDIGANGNIYVADWTINRISVFNETGEAIDVFGSEGAGDGALNRPDAIALDGQGGIWVGDSDNSRLEEFNEAGEYVAQIGSPGSGPGQFSFLYPMGIETGSNGSIWVTDTRNNRVQRWVR
jgi:sugar lactone lactonase YvrE